GHVGHVRDHQVATLPGNALHLDVGVQVPPVGAVDPGRDLQLLVRAEREIGAQPAEPPDHRDGAHPPFDLPVDIVEQLDAQPPAGQVVAELAGDGQGREHAPADLVQVGVHQVEVLGQVVVA